MIRFRIREIDTSVEVLGMNEKEKKERKKERDR
jgi:hypothetical protein